MSTCGRALNLGDIPPNDPCVARSQQTLAMIEALTVEEPVYRYENLVSVAERHCEVS